MVRSATANCVNHRRRPKLVACGACGNPLCSDCVVRTSVGVKCQRCTGMRASGVVAGSGGTARPEAAAGARRRPGGIAGARRLPGGIAGARRRPLGVALVAAGVAVAAVAAYGLISRDSEPVAIEGLDLEPAAVFTERHSAFQSRGGQSIGGTLTLPGAGDGRDIPAVLIVPGLGALDRDSVVAAGTSDTGRDALLATVSGAGVGNGDPLYRDLAESLARAGVASFRYERRGTQLSPLQEGRELTYDDELGDALAALDVLGQRQEVGSAPVAILGHDTGGLVAMRLAAANRQVRAVVLVSTPGRPLLDVLADDLARSREQALADQLRAAAASLITSEQAPAPESVPELYRPIFAAGHDGYLRTILTLDPVAEATGVNVPVLLVRGGADRSVTSTDTDLWVAALQSPTEVMVGSSNADHNLTLGGSGHEHSNTASAPVSHRDADATTELATWVKTRLAN